MFVNVQFVRMYTFILIIQSVSLSKKHGRLGIDDDFVQEGVLILQQSTNNNSLTIT